MENSKQPAKGIQKVNLNDLNYGKFKAARKGYPKGKS